ncbi:MAG: 50S ribosomal protein L23 [Candidatus Sumerlaeia bacterium]|nr:50S ribosomal protein L23 [Candidatus Sumerlaeia bacterium]
MKNPYDILVRPLITERALAEQLLNKYTFEVAISANKKEIKTAVEKAFGVKVLDVNTTTKKGVTVVRFGRRPGKKADVKKAIITLAPGQALEYT